MRQRMSSLGVRRSEGIIQTELEGGIRHDFKQGHSDSSVQAGHALVLHDALSCLDHAVVHLRPAPFLPQLPSQLLIWQALIYWQAAIALPFATV